MEKFFGNFSLCCYCQIVHEKIFFLSVVNKKKNLKLCVYFPIYQTNCSTYLVEQLAISHRCFFQVFVFFFSIKIQSKFLKYLFFFSNCKKNVSCFFSHTPFLTSMYSFFFLFPNVFSNKDLDGISFKNQFSNFFFKPSIFSCTAKGVLKYLKLKTQSLKGLYIVLASTSNIIGIPLVREFLREGACVSIFKEVSSKLCQCLLRADIFVSAFPNFLLFGDCFLYKKQLILIDIAFIKKGDKINGNFSLCTRHLKRSIFVTPIPGGIGPLTMLYFLRNAFILLHELS